MKDDDHWFDLMAGRTVEGADEATRAEALLFREALLSFPPEIVDAMAPLDSARTAALLVRADQTGILAPRAVPDDHLIIHRVLRAFDAFVALSSLQRLSVLGLLLVVCLPLIHLSSHLSTEPVPTQRAPADTIVVLHAKDPAAAKAHLLQELTAAGLKPTGYTRLGRAGIDVDLGSPATPAAQKVLERHGLSAPADGVLQIEIEGPP